MNRIPKIIHYCWFGKHNIPDQLQNYIDGWHKELPDFKFIRWSENNFNWRNIPFTRKEYLKHNWAFVSDYVRLYALYHFGGVYLDTDVQILRPIYPLLNNKSFMGMEDWNSIASGLICGSIPHEKNIKNILNLYRKLGHKDINKLTNYYNTVNIITLYFRKYGFKYRDTVQFVNGCKIYSTPYFCPEDYMTHTIHSTAKSYTIHHYSSSWINEKMSKSVVKHIKESNFIKKIIGPTMYRKLYKYYLYYFK